MKLIDRLISILLLVILAPIALVTIATLIVNWDRLPEVGETAAGYGVQAVELAFLCGRVLLIIGVLAAIAVGVRYGLRWWHNYNQQRDVSHHLRTYPVVDPATGQRVKILVNPDLPAVRGPETICHASLLERRGPKPPSWSDVVVPDDGRAGSVCRAYAARRCAAQLVP